jgi:hypothetical protein
MVVSTTSARFGFKMLVKLVFTMHKREKYLNLLDELS